MSNDDDTPFDLGPPPPIFLPPLGPVAGAPPPVPVAFVARTIVPSAPPPEPPPQPKMMALSAKAAPGTHTVKPGDSLGAIAERYDTTVSAILEANPQITNPNQISVGQQIKLPGASSGGGTGGTSPQPSQPKPPPKKPPAPKPDKDDDDDDEKKKRKLIFPLWRKPTASWKDGPRYFGCPRSGGRKHGGVDLYAPFGAKIRAIADGVIIRVPYFFYDGTNALEVFHPGVGVVRYGEISSSKRVSVRAGQKVKCGEHIAYVGLLDSLGMSMIHFELFGERARGQALTQMSGAYRRHPALKNPTKLIDKLYRLTF